MRVEQLFPLAKPQLVQVLKKYPKLERLIWAQEEPKNMGSWLHIAPRITDLLKAEKIKLELEYCGRPERSSPATGSVYRHKVEQAEIIDQALK